MKSRGSTRLRLADRYVGIPLLAILGLLRRRASQLPPAVLSIGVMKTTAIGDTVLLSGALHDLAAAHPQAQLTFIAGPDNAALVRLFPEPRQVVVVDPTSPVRVVSMLRDYRFDLLIDCGPWARSEAVYSALSGAAGTVGYRTKGQHRHFCQDVSVDHLESVHESENYRRLMAAAGATGDTSPRLLAAGTAAAARFADKPYIVVHAWPSGVHSELKEWPSERWCALIRLLEEDGYVVALSGGPADVPKSAVLAKLCSAQVADLAGQLNLAELTDVLNAAACVVSVNTGVMHMAAALGVPTVSLNGPTSERRWGPVGRRATSVNSRFPGCGFLHLGGEFEGNRTDCMLGIDVQAVYEAITSVVQPVAPGRAV
ncbi:MAG TPA: glycosyltransferase family 9 protein [Dermatophilaceae bacterium]|jgi:ADP-heptose:LPS heptosyltransferase